MGGALAARLGGEVVRGWEGAGSQREHFAAAFAGRGEWVLVMASGIAVRFLQGLARDKHRDPAVVLLDEGGRFAVSLLSGHEGGANALAYRVANAVGAVPVVTTATEVLKPLVVGVGCRRGVEEERIRRAVEGALGERTLAEVREVATIDAKAEEPGLLEFCGRHGLPLRVLGREAVAARPWTERPSAWVRRTLGVDGVCEPCALIAAPRGRLLVPKTTLDGVAVAVVEDNPGGSSWLEG
ncbi:MAG: cobalamin biosynthesis protein [Gemmatimonadetes bacterium]|nr:cobalamin biosynthesis protein [Gemmatimonadota bacterium]